MKITKKTEDRIKASLPKFQTVLGKAKDRELNESDTVSIIADILADVFGYDKYLEVTSEYAIRGTYCDLAIKIGDKVEYLIECKSITTDLKEIHLNQAFSYGAKEGIQWIILTNGIDWQIYRMTFRQPVTWDMVARFDLTAMSAKNERDMDRLAMVTKEGVEKNAREEMYQKVQCVNRYVAGALILSEPIVAALKREFRKLAEGINVTDAEVESLLRRDVLRKDLLEGEEAEAAMKRVNKHFKRAEKKQAEKKPSAQAAKPETTTPPAASLTEQLLAEAEAEVTPAQGNG